MIPVLKSCCGQMAIRFGQWYPMESAPVPGGNGDKRGELIDPLFLQEERGQAIVFRPET